jgi:hypothetical protein
METLQRIQVGWMGEYCGKSDLDSTSSSYVSFTANHHCIASESCQKQLICEYMCGTAPACCLPYLHVIFMQITFTNPTT